MGGFTTYVVIKVISALLVGIVYCADLEVSIERGMVYYWNMGHKRPWMHFRET